jgi:hypothetical protein
MWNFTRAGDRTAAPQASSTLHFLHHHAAMLVPEVSRVSSSRRQKIEKISYLTPEIMLLSYLAPKLKFFPIRPSVEFFFPI